MFLRSLSPELQKKAEAELNEIADRREEDLQHIRDWLEKQPHLKIRKDDQWLINFLRGCKFSLQRTKEKLDYLYTMRSLVPELFDNRDPLLPELQEVINKGILLPLPKTADPVSPRIILVRWGECNPETMPYVNLVKVYFMCIDILMNEDDNCVIAGIHSFIDLKGFSANYLLQCTPAVLKKVVLCIEKAYPVRIKKMDYCNAPAAFEILYDIAKPLFSEKLKNRISIYSEGHYANVFKVFSKTLLPKEYGGNNGSVEELTEIWKQKFESNREWFLEDSKLRSCEELRPGSPRTSADVFGIEGSFRKLAVD